MSKRGSRARLGLTMRTRRAVRRAIGMECQVVRERDFRLLGRLAIDVSPAGILVPGHEDVRAGENVIVSFRLPRTKWWFDAEGTVARLVQGRRPGDPGRGFAVGFDRIEADAAWLLDRALRDVPPPFSRRTR
jgi:hypothetical protein